MSVNVADLIRRSETGSFDIKFKMLDGHKSFRPVTVSKQKRRFSTSLEVGLVRLKGQSRGILEAFLLFGCIIRASS
jgi:hypothetical protein